MILKKNIILGTIINVYRELPKHLKKRSYLVVLSLFINAITDLLSIAVLFPVFLTVVTDDLHENKILDYLYSSLNFSSESKFLIAVCVTAIILIIIKSIVFIISRKYQAKFAQEIFKHFTERNLRNVIHSGYSNIKEHPTKDILRDVSNVPRVYSAWIVMPILIICNELIILSFIFCALVYLYSFVILLVIIPVFLAIILFYYLMRKHLDKIEKEINLLVSDNLGVVLDTLNGYQELFVNEKFDFFRKRFSKVVDRERKLKIDQSVISEMPVRVIELGVIIAIVIVMLYSYFYVDSTEGRIALLGVFGLAAFKSTPSLNKILTALVRVKGKQFIFEILQKWKDIAQPTEIIKREEIQFERSIALENITFSYKNKKIFNKATHRIEKGEFTGIVGPSGSGKSTLIRLLLTLVRPESGNIKVDDVEINNQRRSSWLERVGYVGQEVFLLDEDIRSNVAFGIDPNSIDDDLVVESLKMAGLSTYLEDLKDGIFHKTGEHGNKLSGGQKQRIGIARALYKKPDILIMDEGTSSLDTQIESEIISTILEMNKINNLTIIFVTHKIENLQEADRIIELNASSD